MRNRTAGHKLLIHKLSHCHWFVVDYLVQHHVITNSNNVHVNNASSHVGLLRKPRSLSTISGHLWLAVDCHERLKCWRSKSNTRAWSMTGLLLEQKFLMNRRDYVSLGCKDCCHKNLSESISWTVLNDVWIMDIWITLTCEPWTSVCQCRRKTASRNSSGEPIPISKHVKVRQSRMYLLRLECLIEQ